MKRLAALSLASSLFLSICHSTPDPCDCEPRGPFDCLDCPNPPIPSRGDAGDHA